MDAKAMSPIPRHRTVADEVAERLVLAMANGEQEPGSRLTEGSVAEAMQVSRVPAREALLSLAAKGLLEPAGARGLKVVDFAGQKAANVREVRIALETVAMRKTMLLIRSDATALRQFDDVLTEMSELAEAPNALALAQCDLRFHRLIVTMAGNDVLQRSWEDLTPHLLVLFCKDWHRHPHGIGEVALHEDIRRFLGSGNISAVESVLAQHFTAGN